MKLSSKLRNSLTLFALLAVLGAAWYGGFLDPLRNGLYDLGQVLQGPLRARDVIVVALDEDALHDLREYPLPDTVRLQLLDKLFAAGVRQVAWVGMMGDHPNISPLPAGAEQQLVIGMPAVIGGTIDMETEPLPAYVRQYAMDFDKLHGTRPWPARSVIPWPARDVSPLSIHTHYPVNAAPGANVRSTPLMVMSAGMLLPTVALQMYLNLAGAGSAGLLRGGGIQVNNQTLWTDIHLQAYPYLQASRGGGPAVVDRLSFRDVLHGTFEPEQLRGKQVLVGVTAAGLVPAIAVPGGTLSPVEHNAYTLASMLDNRLTGIPGWSSWAIAGLVALVMTLLAWLPSIGVMRGLLLAVALLISVLGVQAWEMMSHGLWLDVSLPACLLAIGTFVMLRYGQRQPAVENAEIGATEIHRRVGLASQKRGELDAAFESFRKCPMDDSIMILLYYLAQNFETSERYDRAGAVYRYMRSYDPNFKDIAERAEQARLYQETVMMNTAGVMPDEQSVDEDNEENGESILGRYRIERRIGRGAMGMVYLGVDPKINRTVAIKTLNLKREFGDDEQHTILQRFFHEAEAAGRLHHPNIVTIYDAGEANDMAYIAMEYLTGSDLRFYTREDSLLPPLTVVKIGMKLADALAYAHSNKIVHRDIKAANVMYDPQTGQLKITDFGIARLADSRRTKTGMVLGTPSSMSPEQLRGKKLDGRTDLYSLGVLLFQLLAGRLPYRADSLTRLMVKITTSKPPDLLTLRPELRQSGVCICEIVNKLLQKEADDRYQNGKKLSRDLLACAKSMAARK